MIYITFAVILFLGSCQSLQPVADDIKEVMNNDAIIIKVDRDAFQKETDVSVSVEVKNKDQPSQ